MKRIFIFGLITVALVAMPLITFAQTSSGSNSPPTSSGGNSLPVSSGGSVTVRNPLGVSSFCALIQALLTGAIQIGIPIAVLFIVYAGFKFILARGKPEELAKARQNFLWTIIGIGIFLGAWLLAQLIANTVNSIGGGSSIISCGNTVSTSSYTSSSTYNPNSIGGLY